VEFLVGMFYENNTWGQLYSHAQHHAEAGVSAKGHVYMLQPAKQTNTGRIPRARAVLTSLEAPSWSISPSGTKL